MEGYTQSLNSLANVLQELKDVKSRLDSSQVEMFSIQQNQASALQQLGLIEPSPSKTTAGTPIENQPQQTNLLAEIGAQLAAIHNLLSYQHQLLDNARFISEAICFHSSMTPQSVSPSRSAR